MQVALAELSPDLPLKVLHKMLDTAKPGESLVGIRYGASSISLYHQVH
jgi:hypothetical protein